MIAVALTISVGPVPWQMPEVQQPRHLIVIEEEAQIINRCLPILSVAGLAI